MPWPRIIGGLLVSLLLLSLALPATCADCFQGGAAENCDEKHGAPRHHSEASMNAKCAACDSEIQAASDSGSTDRGSSNLSYFSSTPYRCAGTAAQRAPLAELRFFASWHNVSDRALADNVSYSSLYSPPPQETATIVANAMPIGVHAPAVLSILKI